MCVSIKLTLETDGNAQANESADDTLVWLVTMLSRHKVYVLKCINICSIKKTDIKRMATEQVYGSKAK